MPTKMQKYLYKAHAIALRGSIRKPYFQELGDHLSVKTYAGSSGRTTCKAEGFRLGDVIQYDTAHTQIDASEQNGIFTTSVTSQVFGLRVGKRLTVGEVTCRLQSVYNADEYPQNCYPRISPAGSIIRNLEIDGRAQSLAFPTAFAANQKSGDERAQSSQDERPGLIPEAIHVPDLGTIFYAEWAWVHPDEQHQQHLTMLRLALGSDLGAAICVGQACSDGVGWPPGNN
jgi:hypothetical protein